MPGVHACTLENLMLAKKPEKLCANMKMACRWVLMRSQTSSLANASINGDSLQTGSSRSLGIPTCSSPFPSTSRPSSPNDQVLGTSLNRTLSSWSSPEAESSVT